MVITKKRPSPCVLRKGRTAAMPGTVVMGVIFVDIKGFPSGVYPHRNLSVRVR